MGRFSRWFLLQMSTRDTFRDILSSRIVSRGKKRLLFSKVKIAIFSSDLDLGLMMHCSASLRSPMDLIICTDPQPDRFRTNPGSCSLFGVNKVGYGSKVVYFRCRRGRLKIVWGPRFCPIDLKIRANDAQGSNYSEPNFSDPLATPSHPLKDRDPL